MSVVEKWLVRKTMHLGPIRDEIREGQIIEWNDAVRLMRIDGKAVTKKGTDPDEAMRMLKALAGRDEASPCITQLPSRDDGAKPVLTRTSVMLPVLGCLKAAGEFIGTPVDLKSVNNTQSDFVSRFGDKVGEAAKLGKELESLADKDVSVINAFLKAKGFDIQLDKLPGEGFAVASILDVLVKWFKEGKATSVRDGKYPAVKLDDGVTIHMGIHGNPLIAIETQGSDVVFITPVDEVPDTTFALEELVDKLGKTATPWRGNNKGVIFPMVDYDKKVDISWLVGLKVTPLWYVAQALQQTKFRMNEVGARAQSAVAMSMRLCAMSAEPTPIIIDRPFLLWIDRKDVAVPIFAGVFAEDVWKKPAGLE